MSIGNIANSGMKAAMSDMEVISNNIANVNTIGYKRSYANFSDLYPTGQGGSVPGLGVQLRGIQQDFSPGQIGEGYSPLSLMVNGEGFFATKDSSGGTVSYTRAGQFEIDSSGYIISTFTKNRLQGYLSNNGTIVESNSLDDLKISLAPRNATATTKVTQNMNLDATATVPTGIFNVNDDKTFTRMATSQIYDSLGTAHTLNNYYVKSGANSWNLMVYVDGASVGSGTISFDTSGQLTGTTGLTGLSFSPTNGAASPQSFDISLNESTQFADKCAERSTKQDGNTVGLLSRSNVSVDRSGNIYGVYSNSDTVLLGKVAVANFQSPEGLSYIGNMSWMQTGDSGMPIYSQSNSTDIIAPGRLEQSNVDLTTEMISLINAQHNFQANAQVEQVYNQVMQDIVKI